MVVTVEEFENYQGVHGDTLSARFVKAAQERVEKYVKYNLEEQNYTSAVPGTDSNRVRLNARPVTEVTEITIDGESKNLSEFTYDDKGFLSWKNGNFSSQAYIEVKYKAGWPVVDDESTAPDDIKMCILRIAGAMQTESGGNVGLSSKSFSESGSTNFYKTRDYTSFLKNISAYRIL